MTLSQQQQEELDIAAKYNATPQEDPPRGEGWYQYTLGDQHIWRCKSGWVVATQVEMRYHEHICCDNLEGALQVAAEREKVRKMREVLERLGDHKNWFAVWKWRPLESEHRDPVRMVTKVLEDVFG